MNKKYLKLAFICLALTFGANFLAYNCGKLFDGAFHYDITSAWDEKIPFIEAFSIIYILAYLQWILNYLLLAREDNGRLCAKIVIADVIAKLICFVFFAAFPTTLLRPEALSDGFFGFVTKIIFWADSPTNLFPSIHCLESWACFRAVLGMKKVPKWFVVFTFIFSVLVFLSTVFLKQHVLIDIIAGIAVFELGVLIVRLLGLDKKFSKFFCYKENI